MRVRDSGFSVVGVRVQEVGDTGPRGDRDAAADGPQEDERHREEAEEVRSGKEVCSIEVGEEHTCKLQSIGRRSGPQRRRNWWRSKRSRRQSWSSRDGLSSWNACGRWGRRSCSRCALSVSVIFSSRMASCDFWIRRLGIHELYGLCTASEDTLQRTNEIKKTHKWYILHYAKVQDIVIRVKLVMFGS